MSRKRCCRLEGNSLFELLISLTLLGLVITLLITTGTQTIKMWRDLEEERGLMSEARTLMRLLDRDLRNASASIPITFQKKSDLFFLRRNSNNDLVAVGYFLDPKNENHCYRFFANPKETLAATHDGKLEELYALAAPGESHCQLIAKHLLSFELMPTLSLLEVNMTFGKTSPRYFVSTVLTLPRSTHDF